MQTTPHIVLASASPRRRELLGRAGFEFEVIPSRADEFRPIGLSPFATAQHIATAKAREVAARVDDDALVIGADTIVVCDEEIFGKPRNEVDARRMLRRLSDRAHAVITGVCLVLNGEERVFAQRTQVVFRPLEQDEIDAYIATGEPMDKAGAYGIQGKGGALVDHIRGDYDNVVGLPVKALVDELRKMGVTPTLPCADA